VADDLLIGIGVDVSEFRRDASVILAEAQTLQREIARSLSGTPVLPDMSDQARIAGESVITGLRQAITAGGDELRRDVAVALLPRSLATNVATMRNVIASGIAGISTDFAEEGADSSAAFLASLGRGLADARAVFAGFSRQVTASLTGTRGILGDLTPQAEQAGRQLVSGLSTSVRRDSAALRREIQAALIPTGLNTAFTPLLTAANETGDSIVVTLGAAGRDSGRALATGLDEGLRSATAAIGRFSVGASTTLERANLLSGLEQQGTRAGGLLVSGVVRAITADAGAVQRAVTTALVPANLPTELRALTTAVATETARLVPVLGHTGTLAARGFTATLTAGMVAGTADAVAAFTRGAQTAIAGTNIIGNLTPIGERAGMELSAGVQIALTRDAAALRTSISAALIPQNLTGEIGRLESSVSASLARFPALFEAAGTASGGALVTGLTSRLATGTRALQSFATETSRALTAALTIGDTSATGERAGRLLANSIATGIAAEAPRVRDAIAGALSTGAVTTEVSRLTETVVAETRTLAPELARQGTEAGRAYIGAITSAVSQGAPILKRLTAGATVGIVVDTAPIRQATADQQQLVAATTEAVQATRQLDAAVDQIDASGIRETVAQTRSLADAQREWLKEAQGASVAAQGAWQNQRNAAAQFYAEQRRGAANAKADAAQEAAARAQVRKELINDIAQLAAYGAQVDGTSRKARAAWLDEANAIRRQAVDVKLASNELNRLDGIIDKTTQSFREQERAARSAANAIRTAGSATPRFGAGVIDLGGITQQAHQTKRAIDQITIAGKSMTQIMTRAGPALVGIGFGLEALARGGEAGASGVRTALRALASFAAFFGPKGLIVSGVAAGTAAILDMFNKTRDEIEETRKKFVDETRNMVESVDAQGLVSQLQRIDFGTVTLDENLNVKTIKGLKDLRTEVASLEAQLQALGSRRDFAAVQEFNRLNAELKKLKPELNQRQEDFDKIRAALQALPTVTTFKQPVITITAKTQDAEDAVKELAAQVNVIRDAFDRSAGNADLQNAAVAKAIPLYDELARLSKIHGNTVSETSNELAAMLRTLTDIDAVSIELTRRKLGGTVPDVGPVRLTGIIDKVLVSPAQKLEIPVGIDQQIFNESIRRAVQGAEAAQNQKVFAQMFGSQQQVADATRVLDAQMANLTRTFRAAADVILRSAEADDIKARKLAELRRQAEALGLVVTGLTDDARTATQTFFDVADAAGSIANAANAMGIFDREIVQSIDDAAQLARALGNVADTAESLKDSGGIFGSVTNILKAIPAIGDLLAAAVNLGRTAFNAITGNETQRANNAILKENNEQLARLSQDLQGFGDTIGEFTATSRIIQESAILSARRGTSGFQRGFRDVEGLDAELRAAGSSIFDLKRRAEQFGITITDAKGRISALGLDQLAEAIELAARAAANFEDTLSDLRTLQDARREIFELEGPQDVFRDAAEQIRQFAPQLFERFLAAIDVSTPAGRQMAEQALRELFDFIASARAAGIDLTPFLQGFESVEDFVQTIVGADNALDDMAEASRAATGELVNVVKGFRDFNLERARFHATQDPALRRQLLATPTPVPTPIPAGATAVTTVGTVTFAPTIQIDGRDKDAVQITTEVVTELRRRAKASANPEVRKTVNLLPT
jgi:hypothetical protein